MKYLSIILLLFVSLNGCAMFKVYYAYNVSAKNVGETQLRDVIITSDKGFWHGTGYLNKGAVKTLGGLKSVPPNGIYTIEVEKANREKSKSVVDLHYIIGKGFRGEIVFIVDDKNPAAYDLK